MTTSTATMGKSKILFFTNLNVVLYALCFWIQIGTLPYLTKKLGVNPVTFGYLQTVFAVVQLMGGPLFGRFGDLFGSRIALAIAFGAAALSYSLLGLAHSVLMVFLSRLPSVLMHAMQGAQMVITDVTDSHERSGSLGKLSLSYGLGMVLGPVIGGLCTKFGSEHFAAFMAALGSLLSVFLVFKFIPEIKKIETSDKKEEAAAGNNKLINLELFRDLVLRNPTIRHVMLVKTISGLPIGVLHSMFSIIMIEHFQLTADLNGYLLSYIGVITMITQGFLIGYFTKKTNDENLIKLSIGTLSLSYAAMSIFSDNIFSFCIVTLPMVVSGALFSTVVQSILTKKVAKKDTGSMLGFSMATHSLIRSVSPTIGGFMFHHAGFASFGYFGFLCNGLLFLYLLFSDTSHT